jgi:hypothetical protein
VTFLETQSPKAGVFRMNLALTPVPKRQADAAGDPVEGMGAVDASKFSLGYTVPYCAQPSLTALACMALCYTPRHAVYYPVGSAVQFRPQPPTRQIRVSLDFSNG